MTTRREFLKRAGGGLAVFLVAPRLAHFDSFEGALAPDPAQQRGTDQISAWLHIDGKGQVTVYTGKVEFGQGIRTSLTQHVAEELRAPVESIRLVMGDTELTPFDQGTFGSRTTPAMAPQLRRAAAAARELLVQRAAELWKADPSRFQIGDGRIALNGTRQSVSFGELTRGEKLVQTIPAYIPLRASSQWTVAGKPLAKVNGRAIVTGKHRYPSDI